MYISTTVLHWAVRIAWSQLVWSSHTICRCAVYSTYVYIHSPDVICTHVHVWCIQHMHTFLRRNMYTCTCVVYSTCTYIRTFPRHDMYTCTCVVYSTCTYIRTFPRHDMYTCTCVVYSTCTYIRTSLRHDTYVHMLMCGAWYNITLGRVQYSTGMDTCSVFGL